jgi:hypothetical protein
MVLPQDIGTELLAQRVSFKVKSCKCLIDNRHRNRCGIILIVK